MIKITRLFGTPWCSDCKVSKSFLADHRIDYNYIDITDNEEAALFVEGINDGKRKVPTIEFSDGTYLVEPTDAELAAKLGLNSMDYVKENYSPEQYIHKLMNIINHLYPSVS
ncbi:MAG: hypothetical protein KAS47_05230 [Candidatus Heimdallarchaeota archaeon]|nr:hypothetical protein [Candidatus Heimdallarchaeota archaeon]